MKTKHNQTNKKKKLRLKSEVSASNIELFISVFGVLFETFFAASTINVTLHKLYLKKKKIKK